MDYSKLVERAWAMTRRYRFLWILGLFAGPTMGSYSCNTRFPGEDSRPDTSDLDFERLMREVSPESQRLLSQATRWVSEHLAVILLAAGLAGLALLLLAIISLIARGGMARATADLALGRPITHGQAWVVGRQLFWRFVRLGLLLFGLGLVVLTVIGIAVALAVLAGWSACEAARGPLIGTAILMAGLLAIVLIPVAIVFGVALAFADRAIAVDQTGAIAALRRGLHLVWSNKGQSALGWLVSLVLGIAAGIGLVIVGAVVLIPLAIVGVVLFFAGGSGVTAGLIGYGVVAFVIFMLVLWILSAVFNAFFWSYWTLVYLRFTGRLDRQFEPLPITPAVTV